MKKRISYLLVALFCMAMLAACGNNPTGTSAPSSEDGLKKAASYIKTMYKDKAEVTSSDYEVLNVATVDGVKYTVTWTTDNEAVKVVAGSDATKAKIDVDEESANEVKYVLTATVSDSNGKTEKVTFNHTVPAYELTTWAKYIEAAVGDNLVCKGIVTGIMSKKNGNGYNCLYFQDNDGGYYAYGMADDPVEQGIKVGMTVKVTGSKDIYSGTHEIKNGVATIVDSTTSVPAAVDFTEIYTNAADLKDAKLVEKQALLVTIKGVEITGQDVAGGYFKFKLAGKESYQRISSSVCPILADKDAFIAGHTEHAGWLADATGVICVYDGAFYLTPVTKDGFVYNSLPTKSDKEMAEQELSQIELESLIKDAVTVTVPIKGKTYESVVIEWTSSDEAVAKFDGEKLVYTLPDNDAKVTLTATAKSGNETVTKTFEVEVQAAASDPYIATVVTDLKADTAYKFGFYQALAGKQLYFTGEASGDRYLATTDNAAKAADVFVEVVDGGYRFYIKSGEAKKYIEIGKNDAGKDAVLLVDNATEVFAYNAESKAYTTTVGENTMYIGTYKTYETMSASNVSYISGDKAADVGVSQFPAGFFTVQLGRYENTAVTAPVADTAYKFGFFQALVGKQLYFTGEASGDRYLATTDNPAKAADVFVEVVDGGFKFFIKVGDAKKYIQIGKNDAGKDAVQLVDSTDNVFAYNAESKAFTTKVGENTMYIGTYKTYETMSASNVSYISGDKAADVGVSQFPAGLFTVEVKPVSLTTVSAPVADKAYKFGFFQALAGKQLFFTGNASGDRYLETSESLAKAADVFAEVVDGGFKFYINVDGAKKYIQIGKNDAGKDAVQLVDSTDNVFSYSEESKAFTTKVGDNTMYIGTYKTYETMSASNVSYISGDKAADVGVSQFPATLYTVE